MYLKKSQISRLIYLIDENNIKDEIDENFIKELKIRNYGNSI